METLEDKPLQGGKVPVGWDVLCKNGGGRFTLDFDNYEEYQSNLMERLGWGECYAVITYYSDGTKSGTRV